MLVSIDWMSQRIIMDRRRAKRQETCRAAKLKALASTTPRTYVPSIGMPTRTAWDRETKSRDEAPSATPAGLASRPPSHVAPPFTASHTPHIHKAVPLPHICTHVSDKRHRGLLHADTKHDTRHNICRHGVWKECLRGLWCLPLGWFCCSQRSSGAGVKDARQV